MKGSYERFLLQEKHSTMKNLRLIIMVVVTEVNVNRRIFRMLYTTAFVIKTGA